MDANLSCIDSVLGKGGEEGTSCRGSEPVVCWGLLMAGNTPSSEEKEKEKRKKNQALFMFFKKGIERTIRIFLSHFFRHYLFYRLF